MVDPSSTPNHACKITDWSTSYPLGFLINFVIVVSFTSFVSDDVCFIAPESPLTLRGY